MRKERLELTAEQLQAISLLVTKPLTGDTFEAIAEKVGVSVYTLWEWRKRIYSTLNYVNSHGLLWKAIFQKVIAN